MIPIARSRPCWRNREDSALRHRCGSAQVNPALCLIAVEDCVSVVRAALEVFGVGEKLVGVLFCFFQIAGADGDIGQVGQHIKLVFRVGGKTHRQLKIGQGLAG